MTEVRLARMEKRSVMCESLRSDSERARSTRKLASGTSQLARPKGHQNYCFLPDPGDRRQKAEKTLCSVESSAAKTSLQIHGGCWSVWQAGRLVMRRCACLSESQRKESRGSVACASPRSTTPRQPAEAPPALTRHAPSFTPNLIRHSAGSRSAPDPVALTSSRSAPQQTAFHLGSKCRWHCVNTVSFVSQRCAARWRVSAVSACCCCHCCWYLREGQRASFAALAG